MFYNHQEIEKKWQKYWEDNQTFKSKDPSTTTLPKFYALDMFPYPSGAGLHVGHPLGYIASDICARYKRHQGFNVLHPIGYDSFGLPAEQYAIQTGQHPAITTENNTKRYEEQLKKIGFSFDWSKNLKTSESSYYKWTQWIFIELFNSWYNKKNDRAESIETLINHFKKFGTGDLEAAQSESLSFSKEDWEKKTDKEKEKILLNYRLAYRAETTVNWCPELGTVLANDEVKDGKSERGGHPVFQKKMMQWSMRITAYAERLLNGLEKLDWAESVKDTQKNWIGKSIGASIFFNVPAVNLKIEIFTTRPDTIFGVSFITLAPEHELVSKITTPEQKQKVKKYIEHASKRSERERMADVKTISGVFSGAYAEHPITKKLVPIWIGDYVLANYGTGAVMAVPAGDERDYAFAKHFDIEFENIFNQDISERAFTDKSGMTYINSDFLNGYHNFDEASEKIYNYLETHSVGKKQINYRLRDAIFSRQRYWGEPVPIYYKDELPYHIPVSCLPIELPKVEKYLPTEDGNPPLGNAKTYAWDEKNKKVVSTESIDNQNIFPLELSTMPGWAGSSWYFIRYMDALNDDAFCDKKLSEYWNQVDLYIGGSEHATGHLIYARFWTMFLKDRGFISYDEPFKKMINQGMILGMSAFVFRINGSNQFVSKNIAHKYETQKIHVDISLLKGASNELDIEKFKNWRPEFNNAEFILEDGKYITEREVEKMSKSKYNVVNPDDICEEYGADCLRLYEMFLGPLEQSKPWNTQGLSGVYNFLKKFYNLYFDNETISISEEEPTNEEYKILHTLIKKITFDIEHFSFNTSISSFMIAVNELQKLKCNKRKILEPLAVIISPFAPHICEELWNLLGHNHSIEFENFPILNEAYLVESEIEYPISINGKVKRKVKLTADLSKEEIEKIILENDEFSNLFEGKSIKKIIIVPKKIINIVI